MSATLSPPPKLQFFDSYGNPLSGGLLYSYAAGTSTPLATYNDASGTTYNTNPVILDSRGEANIWLGASAYKFKLATAANVEIWTVDNITNIAALSAATGASLVGYVASGTDAVATTVQAKLRELVSVKDFGAVGNGVADDTAAVTAGSAYPKTYVPTGTYDTTFVNYTTVPGSWWGVGQIADASNRKLAPWYANANAAPSSTGSANSLLTAFNGDLTRCQFPVGHSISGATTLTQPTTGYAYVNEVYPHFTYLNNTSGWNNSTSGNTGRTAACAYRTKVDNYGQGDCVAYNATAFVTGTRAGSTNFLANPGASLFNGDITAGADGVYLNPYETGMTDGGYDVACVGLVNNFNRTNATGAKSTIWNGYRAQSIGSATCDALVSATGKWVTGLDLTMSSLDFGVTKAAISLKANDRIYLNNTAVASGNLDANWRTTTFNNTWIAYNSTSTYVEFVHNNGTQLAIGNTASVVNYFRVDGGAAGGSVVFRTAGADTNINAGYLTKGTGDHYFYSNASATAAIQFVVNGNAIPAVNYLSAAGAAAGVSPSLTAAGTDTNIDARFNAKGTGLVDLGTQTAGAAGAASGYMVIKVSGVSYKVPLYAM